MSSPIRNVTRQAVHNVAQWCSFEDAVTMECDFGKSEAYSEILNSDTYTLSMR